MNYFGLFRILVQASGNAIIESHSNGDQHIAFICQNVRAIISMHAEHTYTQWMISWNSTHSKDGPCGGQSAFFNELLKFFFCPTKDHTLAEDHERFLCCINQFGSFFNILLSHDRFRTIASYMIGLFVSTKV